MRRPPTPCTRRRPAPRVSAGRWLSRTVVALLALLLAPAPAGAEPGMQASKLPLWKAIDQPFFSLEGSHVELVSLLFLFMATAVAMAARRRRQLVRHIVQIASLLVFFYIVFSCLGVFGMIRNTLHGISLIGTVYTESFFWMSLPICVLAFSLTSGPFFCSWICPTGTIQELVTMGRELLWGKGEVRPTRGKLLLVGLFFAGFLYLTFSLSRERQLFVEDYSLHWAAATIGITFLVLTRLADDVPTRSLRWASLLSILLSAVFKTVITSPVHFAFVDVMDPASAITTLILAVASFFIGRAWCRYLCPWGMLMTLVHRRSRLKVRVMGACSGCGTCVTACRVGAVEIGRVRTDHCQLCFACVDACPHGAIAVVDDWLTADRRQAPAAGEGSPPSATAASTPGEH